MVAEEINTGKKIITSDDILGKDLLDVEGKYIGVTSVINIDKKDKKIIGLTADRGFMRSNVFVGTDLIKTLGVDSIILNTVLPMKYLGMEVYDINGHKVGKVKASKFKENIKNLVFIKVKKNFFSNLIIPNQDIKKIESGIILKKNKNMIFEEWKSNKKQRMEEYKKMPLI